MEGGGGFLAAPGLCPPPAAEPLLPGSFTAPGAGHLVWVQEDRRDETRPCQPGCPVGKASSLVPCRNKAASVRCSRATERPQGLRRSSHFLLSSDHSVNGSTGFLSSRLSKPDFLFNTFFKKDLIPHFFFYPGGCRKHTEKELKVDSNIPPSSFSQEAAEDLLCMIGEQRGLAAFPGGQVPRPGACVSRFLRNKPPVISFLGRLEVAWSCSWWASALRAFHHCPLRVTPCREGQQPWGLSGQWHQWGALSSQGGWCTIGGNG